MGAEVGRFVRGLHESNGVVFHLGATVARVDGRTVTLERRPTRRRRPRRRRRRRAADDRAGRGAGPRDRSRRRRRRVPADERARHLRRRRHRALARSAHRRAHPRRALGRRRAPGPGRRAQHARPARSASTRVPFFWSQHYDVSINYVGHAEQLGRGDIDGDLAAHDAAVSYKSGRPHAGGRDGLPRHGEPRGGA